MTTKIAQVETLVRAHYAHDEERFRLTVLQIAAQLKDSPLRDRIVAHTKASAPSVMRLLPRETQGLTYEPAPCTLSELTLAEPVAHKLERIALGYEHRVELIARGLPPAQRLLFIGPPGNGKTSAAAALGARLGLTTLAANLANVVEGFMGGTGKNLGRLFEALQVAPVVLVLNEIDSVGSHRDGGGDGAPASKEYNSTVNTLLTLMDRPFEGILVATTNRVDMLDPALRRRFDREVEFLQPTTDAIARHRDLIARKLGMEPIAIPEAHQVSFDSMTKYLVETARESALTLLISQAKDP